MDTQERQDSTPVETSGYVEQIGEELGTASGTDVQNGFSDLGEFYVSPNGHTRLFTASRYGKTYVLKCLKADYLYTPLYRQALTKEFEIGLQLDHPRICRTIGMEDVETLGPAIVMERVDGQALKCLIEQRALTRTLARKLAGQILDAVGYMHSKQIIHRDLKPSNIMVTHNGHDAKLVDFSLADSDAFNVLKQPAGTSGYIAPEQLMPGAKADTRADIYSLGMVMKDMAQATGDKQMERMAALCTRRNVDERPADVAGLVALGRRNRKQRRTLAVLILLTVLAGACAAAALYYRLTLVQGAEYVDPEPDGNKATDCRHWPARP